MFEQLLLLLVMYGIVAFGLLWWRRSNAIIVISCAISSILVGYYVFTYNAEVVLGFIYPQSESPFTSVESVVREVQFAWQLRYYFEGFGWLIGLIYFGILYLVVYICRYRTTIKSIKS